MMLYDVEFSQDGKIFDDYIGDYVKAWNAEEAKEYAITWYTENGGKEEDIEDVQVSLHGCTPFLLLNPGFSDYRNTENH